MVNRAVVLMAVHAHDDGDFLTLRRSGGDDFLRARLEMSPGLRGVGEQAGAFDHDLYPDFLPRERGGAFAHGEAFDPLATHDQRVVFSERRSNFSLVTVSVNLTRLEGCRRERGH